MSGQERDVLIVQMAVALLLAFERTPGFSARLQAYRGAGLDLSAIDTAMDRQAVMKSIGYRLRESSK